MTDLHTNSRCAYGNRLFIGFLSLLFIASFGVSISMRSISIKGQVNNQVGSGKTPALGLYRLGMSTSSIPNLRLITGAEKQAITQGVEFKNEYLYYGPSIHYGNINWDVAIAAVDNNIYKISALASFPNISQLDKAWGDFLSYINFLGKPSEGKSSLLVWDREDGNIVLNRSDNSDVYAIVLTLTSHAVVNFTRIK